MKLSIAAGMAAGLLALVAAPRARRARHRRPPVEGATRTALRQRPVTTDDAQPVVAKAGADARAGRAPAGALERGDRPATGMQAYLERRSRPTSSTRSRARRRRLRLWRLASTHRVHATAWACSTSSGGVTTRSSSINGDQGAVRLLERGDAAAGAVTGPRRAKPGATVTLKVTARQRAPVAGRDRRRRTRHRRRRHGDRRRRDDRATHDFKATKDGDVRSEPRARLRHRRARDGACGRRRPRTTGAPAPVAAAPTAPPRSRR